MSAYVSLTDSTVEPGSGWRTKWQECTQEIQALHPQLTVLISKPEQAGKMMSRHITYLVHTDPLGHSVRRRWSEFLWLRDILSKIYTGMFVPVLPTGSVFTTGTTDADGDFVRNRVNHLNNFMKQLMSIPFLLSDSVVNQFLSITGEREFKAMVESFNKASYTDDASSGAVAWRNMLETATNVPTTEQFLEDLRKYLDTLKTSVTLLQDQCNVVSKTSLVHSTELSNLTTAFAVWSDSECSTTELPVEALAYRAPDIKKWTDAVVVSFGHWASSTHSIRQIFVQVVTNTIQDQLAQIDGFRELLKARDSMQQALEKAEKERVKLLEEKTKASGAAPPPASRLGGMGMNLFGAKGGTDLNEAYNKKDEQVAQLSEVLARFTRALHFCEIYRFQAQRSEAIRLLLAVVVSAHIQTQQRTLNRWQEIASLSTLNVGDFAEQVQSILSDTDQAGAGASGATRRIGSGTEVSPSAVV